MLDLFCGRGGWTNAFLARGWECIGLDINPQPEYLGQFAQRNILLIDNGRDWESYVRRFDFICASSPCEQFAVFGMKHFHPNPPYPAQGIRLFEHTRALCEASGVPYVMENVRAAQQFVGTAWHHSGSFYLWGSGVPALLPAGTTKGFKHREMFAHDRTNRSRVSATIPPELANCVAEYAERILEGNGMSSEGTRDKQVSRERLWIEFCKIRGMNPEWDLSIAGICIDFGLFVEDKTLKRMTPETCTDDRGTRGRDL